MGLMKFMWFINLINLINLINQTFGHLKILKKRVPRIGGTCRDTDSGKRRSEDKNSRFPIGWIIFLIDVGKRDELWRV